VRFECLSDKRCRFVACFAGWLLCAAAEPAAPSADPAEIVFYNARVFTAEPLHPYADSVALRGDRIIAVGAVAQVAPQVNNYAKRVDLGGRFLMPGMLDAHAHPIEGGLELVQVRYSAMDGSVPNLVHFVESQASEKAAHRGDALVIYDLDLGFWGHLPELDLALSSGTFAKQRVALYGSDGHTAWANRAARDKAGVTRASLRGMPESERRFYGHDDNLEPNGFLVDAGRNRLTASLPAITPEIWLAAAKAAVEYMHSFGITGWLDAAPAGVVGGDIPLSVKDPGVLPVYRALAAAQGLTVHVRAYPVVKPDLGSQQVDVVQALQALYNDVPNFKIPGLKVFADGVVEFPSQTAALTKPYVNSGRSMSPLFTAAKMNALVAEAYRRGLAVHIHAIGDLAVKQSLDAFKAARRANPSTTLPFVLTHAQFVDAEDIPRFAQIGVTAALQLLWALADPSTNEMVKPYIDAKIYRQMYPARSLLDSGAVIAGASDWPVSSPNPFLAIYQAETRRGVQGVLDETQRMPRAAMLYAYTRHSAAVLDLADQIGSIAPGKLADLVLVDRDVLTVPVDELKEAKVVWTLFAGKAVYGEPPF
jgi:predicted amidohydrolase YtcJ